MAGAHANLLQALVFAAFVAWIAWKCIPKATQICDSQRLPTRAAFFDEHLHRVYGLVDDDCIVCRDKCEMPVRIDTCGHVTCESCARDWFAATRENKRCPQCQAIVMAPEVGTGEALIRLTFVVAVFNNTLAIGLTLLTGRPAYTLVSLLFCGELLYYHSRAMLDAGGDWWRQVSNGPDRDFGVMMVITIGPWAAMALFFSIKVSVQAQVSNGP